MRPQIKIELLTDSSNRANTLRNRLDTDSAALPGASRHLSPTILTFPWESPLRRILIGLHCATEAQALSFRDAVIALWTSGGLANTVLVGSYVKVTRDFDDEGRPEGAADELVSMTVK